MDSCGQRKLDVFEYTDVMKSGPGCLKTISRARFVRARWQVFYKNKFNSFLRVRVDG